MKENLIMKVAEVIGNFFNEFGYSFLILVGMGFVIAILIEFMVKRSTDWLAGKWEGKERLLSILQAVRISLIQVVAWALSVWFGILLQRGMPLPGNGVLLPLWIAMIYCVQCFFSTVGIKGFIAWRAERNAEKANAVPKPKKVKPVRAKDIYVDANGNFVDKNGNPISQN